MLIGVTFENRAWCWDFAVRKTVSWTATTSYRLEKGRIFRGQPPVERMVIVSNHHNQRKA